MVCPNCHSHDVISVQDQLFCVNCGRLLTKVEAAAQEKGSKPAKSAAEAKRRPGRPRAAKLDTPRVVPARAVASEPVSVARSINDINAAKPAPQGGAPKSKRVAHHSIIVEALRALRPIWVILALPGAAVVAGAITLVIWGILYTTKAQQEQQLVVCLLLALSGMIWLRFIRSSIIFYRAGVHDHRLMGVRIALRASAARTGQLCLFGLRHSAAALAELSALAIVVWYGGRITQLPMAIHVGLLFAVCFGLLYLLGSLWVVQRLVEAGIIISDLALPTAHWLGWQLWRRHWELLGARFGGLLVVLTASGGVAVALRAGLEHLALGLQISVVVAVASIGIAALTVISGGAAEATYRQLIALSHSQRTGQLLGRRRALQPSRGALALLLAGLLLPAAIAALAIGLWR